MPLFVGKIAAIVSNNNSQTLKRKRKILEQFKFRAEGLTDISALEAISEDKITLIKITKDDIFPDIEVEFKTTLSLDEIRDLFKLVPDGHVMFQTVLPIEKYTGVRDFTLDPNL